MILLSVEYAVRSITANVSRLCFVAEKQTKTLDLKTKLTNTNPNIELCLKPQ